MAMRRRAWIIAVCVLGVAPRAAEAGAKPVGWIAYADCAAAYRANARLTDPERPASMTSQIFDVASDYAGAALEARTKMGAAKSQARRMVEARISRQTLLLGHKSRQAVEHIIDACPQLGG